MGADGAGAMNIRLTTKELSEALARVAKVTPQRAHHPALGLATLEYTDRLRISGSSMDMDIRATVPAEGKPGSATVFTHLLASVVRNIQVDTVQLRTTDSQLKIEAGNFKTGVRLAEVELRKIEWPSEYEPVDVPGEAIASAIRHVQHAAATAEYQAVFRNLCLQASRIVATDGYRLAMHKLELPFDSALLPGAAASLLVDTLNGDVRVCRTDWGAVFASGGYELAVKFGDGTFPDVDRVIPGTFPVTAKLNARELSAAITRVAVMADQVGNNRVDVHVGDGAVRIVTESGSGEAEETVTAELGGSLAAMSLAFNARYLMDALKPLQKAEMRFSGATTPALVSWDAYTAMVVPLKDG